jgi:CMP-N-acetylneuraminic acid synthetase
VAKREVEVIVFIPIKAESQRVPHKNFRSFDGLPLWQHTVDKYVKQNVPVYIDTDSPEIIATVRKTYKHDDVHVYQRKRYLLGHETSVNKLIDDFFVRGYGMNDIIAQIHVTNPFLKVETVVRAAKTIYTAGVDFDSVVSCDRIQARAWMPLKRGSRHRPLNHKPTELQQTQDLSPIVIENSCFYIFTFSSFSENNKNRVGQNPFFYHVAWPENLDIDIEADWEICQQVRMIV